MLFFQYQLNAARSGGGGTDEREYTSIIRKRGHIYVNLFALFWLARNAQSKQTSRHFTKLNVKKSKV